MRKLLPDAIVLDLIEHVYRAGCDPAEWRTFVERVHAQLPGISINALMSINGTTLAEHSFSAGIPAEHAASYFAHYYAINPYNELFGRLPIGEVRTIPQVVDRAAIKRHAFYNEWLKPAGGFTHGAGLVVARDERRILRVSIDIPERLGHLENPGAVFLRRIGPHLLRAFEVNDRFAAAAVKEQALEALIESVDGPAALVSAKGKVAIINRSGEKLMRAETLIRMGTDGRIGFLKSRHQDLFRRALAASSTGADAGALSGFHVIDRAGSAYAISVLPLRPASSAPFMSPPSGLALLTFRDSALKTRQPVALMQRVFGLTEAESKIAAAIASGFSVAQAAERQKVSRVTARNQLNAAMAKLVVHRQAELAAKIASLSPRLAGGPTFE